MGPVDLLPIHSQSLAEIRSLEGVPRGHFSFTSQCVHAPSSRAAATHELLGGVNKFSDGASTTNGGVGLAHSLPSSVLCVLPNGVLLLPVAYCVRQQAITQRQELRKRQASYDN